MMILRSSPASPFGRKVKIALALLGLKDRVEVAITDATDPSSPLRTQNPLSKIPTLISEDGKAIYDSRVILDYLDHLAGGGKIIPAGPARYDALVMAALADGVMDAALLLVYEGRYRDPAKHEAKWIEMQSGRIARALDLWVKTPPSADLHVGTIGVACALGYLDLRHGGEWRKTHPALVSWLDAFAAKVPAFEETRVKS